MTNRTHNPPAPTPGTVPYDAPPPPCVPLALRLSYRYPRAYALAAYTLTYGGMACAVVGALMLIG